jgi:hypothetical protein
MKIKWLIMGGIFSLAGSLLLLGYTLFSSPATTPLEKDAVIAEIIRNWQQAHPAEKRFALMPAFNNDAVLDKETGLVWELSPQTATVTWNEARTTCIKRFTGGQKGWRLPSPAEMRSLVGPAVDAPGPNISPGHPFLNVQPTSYWTVVPEANLPPYAQYLDAFLGNVLSFIKIYTFPVWCVRGPLRAEEY